jgi:hypothetical protein
MAHTFTREELHKLVWSEPMKTVSARFGVSDVALAKACRRADIPVPERGYWARKAAGKPTIERPLPLRFPGASNTISVGGRRWEYVSDPHWREKLINNPLPPAPTFDESIDAVTERVQQMIGKVKLLRDLATPHRSIAPLLEKDEERRKEFLRTSYDWYKPHHDSPSEQRRLKILNSLFTALQRIGCPSAIGTSKYDQEISRDFSVQVSQQTISCRLEPINSKKTAPGRASERLRLTISSRRAHPQVLKSWEDNGETRLEGLLGPIVVEILVAAEEFHRNNIIGHHEWLVQERARIEEEIRQEQIEAEQEAREQREREEKERIDRLLAQATDLHQSNTIRAYVGDVRAIASQLPVPLEDLDRWASWALKEADRIDPTKNGTVTSAIADFKSATEGAAD